MQNRSAIWVFTILLAFSALYSLSFSFFTNKYETAREVFVDDSLEEFKIANDLDSSSLYQLHDVNKLKKEFSDSYDKDNGELPLVPLIGSTYNEAKDNELKQGLDLQGGMSAVLELSISDLITNLAGNKDESFDAIIQRAKEMQIEAEDDFVTLFERAWNEVHPEKQMISVFHSQDRREKFPMDMTDNAALIEVLRGEANAAIESTETIIRARIDKYGVAQPTIQRQAFSGRILVELPGVSDVERFRKLLKQTANLEFWKTHNYRNFEREIAAANTSYSRLNASEPKEEINPEDLTWDKDDPSTYTIVAGDTIAVAPEVAEESTALLFGGLIQTSSEFREGQTFGVGKSTWGYVDQNDMAEVRKALADPQIMRHFPGSESFRFLWGSDVNFDNKRPLYAIRVDSQDGKPALTGDVITDARQDFDPLTSDVQVTLQMNSEGMTKWGEITEEAFKNNQDQIAIAMDSLVYSSPSVNEPIKNGSSRISVGGGTRQEQVKEAQDLANLLKAGALPAAAKIVNEQIVGSTIGDQNKKKGINSFIIALLLILLYMFLYYKGAGLAADIALIANLFFLIGALASVHAALTLPGIAGIILTIGMSVDANVLIFERVKEELRAGAGLQAAMKKGYNKAYSAIVDANVTTFLTAIILFVLGSGPIKGFATTLMIGIFTSLFTAIFITRLIFSWRSDKKKPISFFWDYSKNLFAENNFNFVGRRKVFYGISAVLVGIGLYSLLFGNKLDLGVDFVGGRKYVIEFNQPVSDLEKDQLRSSLGQVFEEGGNEQPPKIKSVGTGGNVLEITTKFMINSSIDTVDNYVDQTLKTGLGSFGGGFDESKLSSDKVDSTISDLFKSQSTIAVIFSLLIIFIYIALRFRRWQYGLGAIIAMTHDVLIVLGLFSIGYNLFPFSMEIDQAFIAAILTVVGYSINDTVVVFDRIREYLNENKKGEAKSIVNSALNSTLSRTLNTSLSTFIVLLIIFIFGSETTKGFIFALMVGVVVGTYSSLFIATPVVVDLTQRLSRKG